MKRIIMIKGVLETLDYFMDKLCLGADELGIEYYVINIKDERSYKSEAFFDFLNQKNCVVFTMNQIGLQLMDGDENFWEKREIPIYDFVQDHPMNYDQFFVNPLKNMHAIVLDKNHEMFMKTYYPPLEEIIFIPNGGWDEGIRVPFDERLIDIFYAGNCNESHPWIKIPHFEDEGAEFYRVCYNLLIENSFLTVEQVIEIYCQSKGDISFELQKTLIWDYGFLLMHNVRRYFKLKVMHALEETGARIEIRGSGWESKGEKWNSNVHIEGRVTSEECNVLSGQAKIGLNFMPWYKNGCSERVFNIMLNGSICLTDVSDYLVERFEHGKELVFFQYTDIDGMISDVNYILQNPDISCEIARRGYEVAKENDTWKHRMKEIWGWMNM